MQFDGVTLLSDTSLLCKVLVVVVVVVGCMNMGRFTV